ncbi:unnamed protein product [Schistosoma margrebowiei]|uniref:Uncharacterized protein n=1 Tax=Schistosoma margrebowiei TaxID=48269 RepID=A0A183LG89_9TREM|nr:unnamed protein product [Schistosoma margrebowiei]
MVVGGSQHKILDPGLVLFLLIDTDLNVKIGKVRTAFLQLKKTWNSKQLSINIFSTNVKTVPLYRAETPRTTTTIIKKCSGVYK